MYLGYILSVVGGPLELYLFVVSTEWVSGSLEFLLMHHTLTHKMLMEHELCKKKIKYPKVDDLGF